MNIFKNDFTSYILFLHLYRNELLWNTVRWKINWSKIERDKKNQTGWRVSGIKENIWWITMISKIKESCGNRWELWKDGVKNIMNELFIVIRDFVENMIILKMKKTTTKKCEWDRTIRLLSHYLMP